MVNIVLILNLIKKNKKTSKINNKLIILKVVLLINNC